MATIHLPNDFKEFLQLLNQKKVKYLLIGGFAVGYYGYPRSTADIDIWFAFNKENINNIREVLNEFGFGLQKIYDDSFWEFGNIIRMGRPPFRIELMSSISGVDFDECFKKRKTVNIDNMQINIISYNHLKINKSASGRTKDLNDLEHLP